MMSSKRIEEYLLCRKVEEEGKDGKRRVEEGEEKKRGSGRWNDFERRASSEGS